MSAAPCATPLGLTLQLYRQQRALSINALGKAAGVDAAYLWRLERGVKQDPSLSVLRKVCGGLQVSPQAFITGWLALESHLATQPAAVDLATLATVLAGSAPPASDEALFAQLVAERAEAEGRRKTQLLEFTQIRALEPEALRLVRELPLLGRIAAGGPVDVEASEVLELVPVREVGLPHDPAMFVLEVEGDSMLGDDIRPGDQVVISPAARASMSGGQIAACRLYGSEITLKHCWLGDSGVVLRASNARYPDMEYDLETCEVLGVVVRVLKSAETLVPV